MIRNTFVLLLLCMAVFSGCAKAQTLENYKQVSDSFYYVEKYDSALHYAQKAEVLVKKDSGENSLAYAFFVGQFFGMNYEKLGDIQTAGNWYKTSISLFEKLHDTTSVGYGETMTNYGNLCTNLGSYSEALPYLVKAENILKDYAEQVDSYGGALNNLANVYSHTGLYSKAEGNYIDLLSLVKKAFKTDENFYGAKLYGNLANIYNRTGLWQSAERNFVKACSIFKKIPALKNDYYTTYFSLGLFYANMKKTDSSLKIFNEIIDSLDSAKDVVLYASALNGLGLAMHQKHKMKEAENYYLTAMKMVQSSNIKPIIYYNAAGNLALFYTNNHALAKADSVYRVLLEAFADVRYRDQYYYLKTFSGFCANLIKAKRYREASDSLESLSHYLFHTLHRNLAGMPQSEMLQFAESMKSNFDLVYSLIASAKTNNAEITKLGLYNLLQLKGMILNNQTRLFRQLRNTTDTTLAGAYNNWLKTRQILYAEYARSYQDRILNSDSLEAMAAQYERQFSADTLFQINEDKNSLIKKIAGSLSPKEAAIEFVRFNELSENKEQVMYGAFILKRDNDPKFVVLCKEQELKQLFTDEKGRLSDAESRQKNLYRNGNVQLYSLAWSPLEKYLKNVSDVYYSPAGILNAVSLNAMPVSDQNMLMDKYNLFFLSSTGNLISRLQKTDSRPVNASIWGKMNYSENIYTDNTNDLRDKTAFIDKALISDDVTKGGFAAEWKPITIEETDGLKTVLAAKNIAYKTFENSNATEENFKKLAGNAPGIIHISTHGFFAPAKGDLQKESGFQNSFTTHVNPLLRCGLVFSGANYVWSGKKPLPGKDDGILTGYEISQMDLSKAGLVVLSACETGLGDIDNGNEGVLGLQRAFKLAGASKLVMSLWKVPPKQTAELMILFYKNLLNGETAASALLHSQKEMRKKYPPYYWAAFVVME